MNADAFQAAADSLTTLRAMAAAVPILAIAAALFVIWSKREAGAYFAGAVWVTVVATVVTHAAARLVPEWADVAVVQPTADSLVVFTLAAMGLLSLTGPYWAGLRFRSPAHLVLLRAVILGSASAALLMTALDLVLSQVLSSADDLALKVEASIPEDDPRNPLLLVARATSVLWAGSGTVFVVTILPLLLWPYLQPGAGAHIVPAIGRRERYFRMIGSVALLGIALWVLPRFQNLAPAAQTGPATAILGALFLATRFTVAPIAIVVATHLAFSTVLRESYRRAAVIAFLVLAMPILLAWAGNFALAGAAHSYAELTGMFQFQAAGTREPLFDETLRFAIFAATIGLVCSTVLASGRMQSPRVPKQVLFLITVGFLLATFVIFLRIEGQVAGAAIKEVRRQFREIPGIMEGVAFSRPDAIIAVVAADLRRFLPYLILTGVGLLVASRMASLEVRYATRAYFLPAALCVAIFALALVIGPPQAVDHIANGNLGGKGSDAYRAAMTAQAVGQSVGAPALAASLFAGFLICGFSLLGAVRPRSEATMSESTSERPHEPVPVSETSVPIPRTTDIETKKLWFDFAKFMLGTVAVGLISLLISSGLKEKELRMLALEKEHLELKMFMSVADMPLEQRRAFALYFSTVARDEQLKKVWAAYRAVIDMELSEQATARLQRKQAMIEATLRLNVALSQHMKKNPELKRAFFDYVRASFETADREQPVVASLLKSLGGVEIE